MKNGRKKKPSHYVYARPDRRKSCADIDTAKKWKRIPLPLRKPEKEEAQLQEGSQKRKVWAEKIRKAKRREPRPEPGGYYARQ